MKKFYVSFAEKKYIALRFGDKHNYHSLKNHQKNLKMNKIIEKSLKNEDKSARVIWDHNQDLGCQKCSNFFPYLNSANL